MRIILSLIAVLAFSIPVHGDLTTAMTQNTSTDQLFFSGFGFRTLAPGVIARDISFDQTNGDLLILTDVSSPGFSGTVYRLTASSNYLDLLVAANGIQNSTSRFSAYNSTYAMTQNSLFDQLFITGFGFRTLAPGVIARDISFDQTNGDLLILTDVSSPGFSGTVYRLTASSNYLDMSVAANGVQNIETSFAVCLSRSIAR